MSESKQTITELLRSTSKVTDALAEALDSIDDRGFDLLVQGKAKFRLVEEQKTGKKPPIDDSCLNQAVSELAEKLKNAESREVAESLLESISHPRKKGFLLLLAKACGTSAGSKDSIPRIERKLIENVVGTKLRSKAIQKVAF